MLDIYNFISLTLQPTKGLPATGVAVLLVLLEVDVVVLVVDDDVVVECEELEVVVLLDDVVADPGLPGRGQL